MNDSVNKTASVVLSCRDLSKIYHDGKLTVDVFSNLQLEVVSGEMVSIIGVSGAGKSSLLHLLAGLDTPTKGEVIVCGQRVHELSENKKSRLRNQHLGFIYQFHHLLQEFDALENVCMPLLIRGDSPRKARQRALDMIARVDLKDRASHRVSELSGGERQRIAIARALVTEPQCVLADEPTGNLDHSNAAHVFELMLHLNKTLETSFVIVTHNESLAHQVDRTLVLKNNGLYDA